MIKFFRRIRQRLLSENKFSKYLIYAFGEIILVVIGILIALQINTWNQNRIDLKIEKQLLSELLENLEVNELRLKKSIEEEYRTGKSIQFVVEVLENKSVYNDSMNYHFGRADFTSDIVIAKTAFEAIKSRGFQIISSDALRKEIIDLFDSEYTVLLAQTVRLEDQFWPNAALPLFHKHFRLIEMKARTFDKTLYDAKPIDYDALLQDEVYINMIKHRGSFRYAGADLKNKALEKTKALKEQINSNLKTL